MAQTTYSTAHPEAFQGMDGTTNADDQTISRVNAEASAEIPFGVMVKQGATDPACLKLTAVANDILGIARHAHVYEPFGTVGNAGAGIPPGQAVGVKQRGEIWVPIEESVTQASDVYVRAVATGSEVAGAFRASADSTDCIKLFGCRWVKAATGPGLGLLHINMNAHRAAAKALADALAAD
jgi:hypothetical protein